MKRTRRFLSYDIIFLLIFSMVYVVCMHYSNIKYFKSDLSPYIVQLYFGGFFIVEGFEIDRVILHALPYLVLLSMFGGQLIHDLTENSAVTFLREKSRKYFYFRIVKNVFRLVFYYTGFFILSVIVVEGKQILYCDNTMLEILTMLVLFMCSYINFLLVLMVGWLFLKNIGTYVLAIGLYFFPVLVVGMIYQQMNTIAGNLQYNILLRHIYNYHHSAVMQLQYARQGVTLAQGVHMNIEISIVLQLVVAIALYLLGKWKIDRYEIYG